METFYFHLFYSTLDILVWKSSFVLGSTLEATKGSKFCNFLEESVFLTFNVTVLDVFTRLIGLDMIKIRNDFELFFL